VRAFAPFLEVEIMIMKVLIACAALAAPCSASAAEPAQEGMTVVRDAVTGKLRAPTSAELRALRPIPRPATAGGPVQVPPPKPASVKRPDGTRAINLGERGMVYAVIHRNADGTLAGHCVKDAAAAAQAVASREETRHDDQ
jgi:hypothetical protein